MLTKTLTEVMTVPQRESPGTCQTAAAGQMQAMKVTSRRWGPLLLATEVAPRCEEATEGWVRDGREF